MIEILSITLRDPKLWESWVYFLLFAMPDLYHQPQGFGFRDFAAQFQLCKFRAIPLELVLPAFVGFEELPSAFALPEGIRGPEEVVLVF